MTELNETEPEDAFGRNKSPEEITEEWLASLDEIGLSVTELADYMKKTGADYRPYTAILRSIQRMAAGETRVSGEMFVIVRMLVRQYRRLIERYGELNWQQQVGGALSAEVDGYTVWLSPQTRGRFIVSCRAPNGFSPEFGRWRDGLSAAKMRALSCVEEGMNDAAEIQHEHRIWQAKKAG